MTTAATTRYPRSLRALRIAVGLVLLATATALLTWQQQVRAGEMGLAGSWFHLVLSGTPHTAKVGSLTMDQVREIATTKLPDLNANDIDAAMKIVEGTARSMGVTTDN